MKTKSRLPPDLTLDQLEAAIDLCESQDGWFRENEDGLLELGILMSDTFVYGSDGEYVSWGDVIELNRQVQSGDKWAVVRYAMEHGHKGMLPIPPIRKLMEES